MQLTVTRGVSGSEARQWVICHSDADALSEVWRLLVVDPPPDLLDVYWRRSDGVTFDLVELRRWAGER